MVFLAVIFGVFSYIIFFAGLLGLLSTDFLITVTVLFFATCALKLYMQKVVLLKSTTKLTAEMKKGKILLFASITVVLLICINFVGTLGPEWSFDALWYHLTLPKLYLAQEQVYFIPGGLLYYSAMPKLVEMLYIPAIAFGTEIGAKGVHFLFGVFSLFAIYRLARVFVNAKYAMLSVLIFASNLVFAWEMTTAYVDLARTFYEILALYFFSRWWKTNKSTDLFFSAVMIGLAITAKLLAVGTLVILLHLLTYRITLQKKQLVVLLKRFLLFFSLSLAIPLPWLVFSYLNTGNPFFPFFTPMYEVGFSSTLLNPVNFFKEIIAVFINAADPLSPLYAIVFPLIFIYYAKLRKNGGVLLLFVLLSFVVWYFTPRTGGGRFILPYLPAFSVLAVLIMQLLEQNKQKMLYRFFIGLVFFIAFITISYRSVTNIKYIPVLLGQQSKTQFLSEHLDFSYGDFYDIDGYFPKNISSSNRVLLYGFHNLYYVDFPFIHESWIKRGDWFTNIAIQGSQTLPEQFTSLKLLYENKTTHVRVYGKKKMYY